MYTLTHLINALCFFGKPISLTSNITFFLLLGIRKLNFQDNTVINIWYTIKQLRQFFDIVAAIIRKSGQVWCCSTFKLNKHLFIALSRIRQLCWVVPIPLIIPGFLTNFKYVVQFLHEHKSSNQKWQIKIPNGIFFTNYSKHQTHAKEPLTLNIPTGVLVNSDITQCLDFY
jgi:ribosomal protein S2